jgi:hypothetical protein
MIHWPLMLAAWALNALAAVLAVMFARRRTEHRPVAMVIVATLTADLVRVPIGLWGWMHARATLPPDMPLSGWPRVAHHLDQVLFLTWPAGLAALSALVFFLPHLRRWALRSVAAVYVAMIAALVLTYPANRPALGFAYAAASLAGAAAVIVGAVAWGRRRTRPQPEHAITLALGTLELALFADPFAPPAPAPFERWSVAQLVYLCTWAAVCALHGGFLWIGLLQAPSRGGRSSQRAR